LSDTTPSSGERSTRLSITCCARCIASSRLRALLLHDGQRRLAGRGAGLHVLFELLETAPGFLERQQVLPGGDGRDELVAERVELGAPHVEPRAEQRHLVLRLLHGGIRPHLDDLLVGLGQLRPGLLEGVLLVGRIELHHRLTRRSRTCRSGGHGRCGACRRPGAPRASACGPRGGRRSRAPSAKAAPLATRAVGTAPPRSGSVGTAVMIAAPAARTATSAPMPTKTIRLIDALLVASAGGLRVATRSPAETPADTIACSRPRRSTVTGVSTKPFRASR
jgi:hypothetical protein